MSNMHYSLLPASITPLNSKQLQVSSCQAYHRVQQFWLLWPHVTPEQQDVVIALDRCPILLLKLADLTPAYYPVFARKV